MRHIVRCDAAVVGKSAGIVHIQAVSQRGLPRAGHQHRRYAFSHKLLHKMLSTGHHGYAFALLDFMEVARLYGIETATFLSIGLATEKLAEKDVDG